MESMVALIAPVCVMYATIAMKQLSLIKQSPFRVLAVRTLVGVLAFGGALGTAWLNGEAVDPASVETAVTTVINFLAASGFYLIARGK
jgi:hypothetical protein